MNDTIGCEKIPLVTLILQCLLISFVLCEKRHDSEQCNLAQLTVASVIDYWRVAPADTVQHEARDLMHGMCTFNNHLINFLFGVV